MPLNSPAGATLSACVVVISQGGRRTVPVIRTTSLATAYLGALCDAAGRAFDWVELWFPRDGPDQNGDAAGEIRDSITPMARWRNLIRQWERSASSGYMNMGWENGLPRPLVLQTETLSWLPFADPKTGRELQFCRDDTQLARAGLPSYSSNTAVFLTADESTFFQAAGTPPDKPV